MSKKRETELKKLSLNKRTISDLSRQQMMYAQAGGDDDGGGDGGDAEKVEPCWVNLWTMYYCDLFVTKGPDRVVVK